MTETLFKAIEKASDCNGLVHLEVIKEILSESLGSYTLVSKVTLKDLEEDANDYQSLRNGGVDNWGGYGDCFE